MATTRSPVVAEVGAGAIAVINYAWNGAFMTGVTLGLYYPAQWKRGQTLLLAVALVLTLVMVADVLAGWDLFLTMPAEKMGQGYISPREALRGPLSFLLYLWFYATTIALPIGLLVLALFRMPRKEWAPILWLLGGLLAIGVTMPLLPPSPFTPMTAPFLFSIVFAVIVGRHRLFLPAEVALGAVFRSAGDGMVICRRDGKVEQVNPTAERLLGLAGHEVRERPVLEVLGPFLSRVRQEAEKPSLLEVLSRGSPEPLEVLLEQEEPERRVFQAGVTPILDERGQHTGCLLVLRDVTERERIRLALEERARLAETLRELSTPIVPVMEGVLILPLIGAIDSERARHIMEDLLEAVRRHRARVVLIDITGVPVVDTMVANHLLRAIQAARLLGCQGVLVGIRAEVARTIVELGLSLGDLVTRGSLQDGLEYVMEVLAAETGRPRLGQVSVSRSL
ncbi:MAG: STAS domain-containing protein, partial [Chloroflexia bacterium]